MTDPDIGCVYMYEKIYSIDNLDKSTSIRK